jgi:hypothetical protein
MDAQRWTRWGMSTNRTWPTARPSSSRRRSSLKAGVSRAATVSQTMGLASMSVGITQKESHHDR